MDHNNVNWIYVVSICSSANVYEGSLPLCSHSGIPVSSTMGKVGIENCEYMNKIYFSRESESLCICYERKANNENPSKYIYAISKSLKIQKWIYENTSTQNQGLFDYQQPH